MFNKKVVLAVPMILAVLVLFWGAGCRPADKEIEEVKSEINEEQVGNNEQVILNDRGILVGQIDSQSVEIEIDGHLKVFGFDKEIAINEISDGSKIAFSYRDDQDRPVLISIEIINSHLKGEGIYIGLLDSRSVEIEFDGQPKAFSLDREVVVDDLLEGSLVAFTYEEGLYRPLLLSIEVIEEPAGAVRGELKGEGILIGKSDAHSVEIERQRSFVLDKNVKVDDIKDGSLVAFTFTETGQRAVLNSIEAVDQPLEGEFMHGKLIGQIDSQSVKIEYSQVFALGRGLNIDNIKDNSRIIFTYRIDLHRPELTSVIVP